MHLALFRKPVLLLAAALSVLGPIRLAAADAPAAPDAPAAAATPAPSASAAALDELVGRIRTKLDAGKRTSADLAPELKEFDALYAKHRAEKTEDTARILIMHAMLYIEVLDEKAPALAILQTLKKDLPDTEPGKHVDEIVQEIEQQEAATKAKTAIVGQKAPELNFAWSSQPGLTTLSALKGKVVVVDFWATWCGPCVATFPKIRELVEHYKGADVVILGATSLQGRVMGLPGGPVDTTNDPAKEKELLGQFIKAKEMTWPVVVTEQEVFNPAYGVSGIPHVAIVGADGTVRHNGLHPAEPLEDKISKIDALLKEAGLKVP